MQVTSYDDKVILAHARTLYRRSGVIEAIYILGGVSLLGVGAVAVAGTAAAPEPSILLAGLAGGLLGGLFGWLIGRDRAEAMRSQAQVALAQVQIELNTRLAVFHLSVRPMSIPAPVEEPAPRLSVVPRSGG